MYSRRAGCDGKRNFLLTAKSYSCSMSPAAAPDHFEQRLLRVRLRLLADVEVSSRGRMRSFLKSSACASMTSKDTSLALKRYRQAMTPRQRPAKWFVEPRLSRRFLRSDPLRTADCLLVAAMTPRAWRAQRHKIMPKRKSPTHGGAQN